MTTTGQVISLITRTIQRNSPPQAPPQWHEGENSTSDDATGVHSASDTFNPGRLPESLIISLFDIRVPSVGMNMTPEKREKILGTLQPGDIVLETCNAYPGWQLVEQATLGSTFTHAAVYEGKGKIIESTTNGCAGGSVMRSDMDNYLHGPELIEIVRPSYKTPEDREAMLDYCRSQIGKPYDGKFDLTDDSEHYCSELVYRGLQAMPHRIHVPGTTLFGKAAVSPDGFRTIEGTVVYTDKVNSWKNMMSHYPVALGAGLSSLAASLVFGPPGAICGLAAGLVLSIAAGNKFQIHRFGLYD